MCVDLTQISFSIYFQKEKLNAENEELKLRIEISSERLNTQTDDTEKLMKALNARTDALQQELNDVQRLLEMYIQMKLFRLDAM